MRYKCFWCGNEAIGIVIELDHFGHPIDVTNACREHGDQWAQTSVHGRGEVIFDIENVGMDMEELLEALQEGTY